jgi:hypothetical protein
MQPPPRGGSRPPSAAAPPPPQPQGYYEMPSYPPSTSTYAQNPAYPATTELNWTSNPLQPAPAPQPAVIPQRGVPLSQQQVPVETYNAQYVPPVNGAVPPRKRGQYAPAVPFAIPKRTVTVKKVELTEKGNLQSGLTRETRSHNPRLESLSSETRVLSFDGVDAFLIPTTSENSCLRRSREFLYSRPPSTLIRLSSVYAALGLLDAKLAFRYALLLASLEAFFFFCSFTHTRSLRSSQSTSPSRPVSWTLAKSNEAGKSRTCGVSPLFSPCCLCLTLLRSL